MAENEETVPKFPWAAIMHVGFSVLRLSSEEFWAMTPREIRSAMGSFLVHPNGSLDRTNFQKLMKAYPDKAEGNEC